MNKYFEVKVKHEVVLPNGESKNAKSDFLVEALSWTEVEQLTKLNLEKGEYIAGDFEVENIKKVKYSELFLDAEYMRFFRAKVSFITIDEKGGNEKKQSVLMLVQANDINEAQEILHERMKDTSDYTVASVTETKIVDVFVYDEVSQNKVIESK